MGIAWDRMAVAALAEVHQRHGRRLLGLPGTWLGSPTSRRFTAREAPAFSTLRNLVPSTEWHYWWQAHYLDVICDAGFMFLDQGETTRALTELNKARALLRGIWLRNYCRFPNYFFDDMAWLALSSYRVNELSLALGSGPTPLAQRAYRVLGRQLYSAHDRVLGGGLYWSRKRNFKNTPVNSPAAVHFARCGDTVMARELVQWMRNHLFDSDLGLYLDGIHLTGHGERLDSRLFTYNQGPIMGALLQLGEPEDLAQTQELIRDIAQHLVESSGVGLKLEHGGDGNLFTGILCRYLALAARDCRLEPQSRATAAELIVQTATTLRGTAPETLSGAVQRVMVFFAAHAVQPILVAENGDSRQ